MGNYLAQPNCAKDSGSGASCRVTYGVSSMQGWRVSMEDAHVIHHRFPPPSEVQWPRRRPACLNGPSTGASTGTATASCGGAPTATTTSTSISSPSTADPSTAGFSLASAGSENGTAAAFKDLVEHSSRQMHLFGIFDGHGGPQVAKFAATAIVNELQNCPQFKEGNFEVALKVAYCNVDRMLKAQEWPRTYADYLSAQVNDGRPDDAMSNADTTTHCMLAGSSMCEDCGCPRAREVLTSPPVTSPALTSGEATSPPADTDATESEMGKPDVHESGIGDDEVGAGQCNSSNNMTVADVENAADSPTSGKENNATLAGTIASGFKHVVSHLFNTATSRFGNNHANAANGVGLGGSLTAPGQGGAKVNAVGTPRQMMRQHSNPAMFAGSTAVCALLIDDALYVANAGDSRAVLCRGGRAETLSKDHKPTLPEERQRIYAAGGFVEYGRVNGNLNLSRALGDLIYKQDASLSAERQIVTGYPDVRKVKLLPEDEFIVIGCDGIWELFSSQDVVDFVRQRLRPHGDANRIPSKLVSVSSSCSSVEYAPRPAPRGNDETRNGNTGAQISYSDSTGGVLSKTVEELFESLLSPNPQLFEFGCDNMTAILVDLRPGSHCHCGCHESQRETYRWIFPTVVDQSDITLKQDKVLDRTVGQLSVDDPHAHYDIDVADKAAAAASGWPSSPGWQPRPAPLEVHHEESKPSESLGPGSRDSEPETVSTTVANAEPTKKSITCPATEALPEKVYDETMIADMSPGSKNSAVTVERESMQNEGKQSDGPLSTDKDLHLSRKSEEFVAVKNRPVRMGTKIEEVDSPGKGAAVEELFQCEERCLKEDDVSSKRVDPITDQSQSTKVVNRQVTGVHDDSELCSLDDDEEGGNDFKAHYADRFATPPTMPDDAAIAAAVGPPATRSKDSQ